MLIMSDGHQGKNIEGMLLMPHKQTYTDLLNRFDELEGYNVQQPTQSPYRRESHTICTDSGDVMAWVYVGQASYVETLSPLEETNWSRYAANKADKINEWWANFESLFP